MLHLTTQTPAGAWRRALPALAALPDADVSLGLWKNTPAVVEVENPESDDLYDERFPMTWDQIDAINEHLVTGARASEVIHEWTLLYRQRLVNDRYDQIQNIIDYLRAKPNGKRAQMSIWDPAVDLDGEIGPCLQIVFCQIIGGKLELHTHMRACDAFGKLMMNVNEFVALQRHIAAALGVPCGKYIQFVDSLHFNAKDREKVEEVLKTLA